MSVQPSRGKVPVHRFRHGYLELERISGATTFVFARYVFWLFQTPALSITAQQNINMSFAEEANSDVPTLPASHSGIPTYLLDKARKAKEGIFEGRTKPQNERQRLPVVPQGIE